MAFQSETAAQPSWRRSETVVPTVMAHPQNRLKTVSKPSAKVPAAVVRIVEGASPDRFREGRGTVGGKKTPPMRAGASLCMENVRRNKKGSEPFLGLTIHRMLRLRRCPYTSVGGGSCPPVRTASPEVIVHPPAPSRNPPPRFRRRWSWTMVGASRDRCSDWRGTVGGWRSPGSGVAPGVPRRSPTCGLRFECQNGCRTEIDARMVRNTPILTNVLTNDCCLGD